MANLVSLTDEVNALQQSLAGVENLSQQAFSTLWDEVMTEIGATPDMVLDAAAKHTIINAMQQHLYDQQWGYVSAAEQTSMTWYDELTPPVTSLDAAMSAPSTYQAQYTPVPGKVTEERVKQSLEWAVNTAQNVLTAKAQLAGAVQRMVMDGSRESIVFNAEKEGVKYVRHCNYATACNWCLVMATRGTVYKSIASATKGHDKCKCIAVPIRKGYTYDPPQIVKDAAVKYEEAKKLVIKDKLEPTLDNILKRMDAIDATSLALKDMQAQDSAANADAAAAKKAAKAEAQAKYVAKKKAEAAKTKDWLLAEAQYKAKQAEAQVKSLSPEEIKKQKKAEAQAKYLAKKKAEKEAAAATAAGQVKAAAAAPDAPSPMKWPPAPDTTGWTSLGSAGGSHGAMFYKDAAGQKWLVKPQSHYKNLLDEELSKFQALTGLVAPPTYTVKLNGKEVSIQKMFSGGNAFGSAEFITPSALSDADRLVLQQNQVFDWLIANHDTHSQQWVRDVPGGTLVGVDKGQGLKWFGQDKLNWDFHPNKQFGEHESVYNTFWKSFIAGDVSAFDPSQGELAAYIKGVQAIPDDTVRALLKPYAVEAAKGGKLVNATDGYHLGPKVVPSNDVNAFLDAVVARKNNLANDMQAFYDSAVAAKTGSHPKVKVAPPTAVTASPQTGATTFAQNAAAAFAPAGFTPVASLGSMVPVAKGGTAEIDAAWSKLSETDQKKIGKQLAAAKFTAKKNGGIDSEKFKQLDAMTSADYYAMKTGIVPSTYKVPGYVSPSAFGKSVGYPPAATPKAVTSDSVVMTMQQHFAKSTVDGQTIAKTWGGLPPEKAKQHIFNAATDPANSITTQAKYKAVYEQLWGPVPGSVPVVVPPSTGGIPAVNITGMPPDALSEIGQQHLLEGDYALINGLHEQWLAANPNKSVVDSPYKSMLNKLETYTPQQYTGWLISADLNGAQDFMNQNPSLFGDTASLDAYLSGAPSSPLDSMTHTALYNLQNKDYTTIHKLHADWIKANDLAPAAESPYHFYENKLLDWSPEEYKQYLKSHGYNSIEDALADPAFPSAAAPKAAPSVAAAPTTITANEAFKTTLTQPEKTKASKALAAAKFSAKKNYNPDDPSTIDSGALKAILDGYEPADYWTLQKLKKDHSLNPVSAMDAGALIDMKTADLNALKAAGLKANHPLVELAQKSSSLEYKQWLLDHGVPSLSNKMPSHSIAVTTSSGPKLTDLVDPLPSDKITNPANDPAKLKIIADLEKAYLDAKPGGTGFNPIKGYTNESLISGIAKFDAEIGVGYLTPAQFEQVLTKLPLSEQAKYLKNYAAAKGQSAADAIQKKMSATTGLVAGPTSAGVGGGGSASKTGSDWKSHVIIKDGTSYTPDRQNDNYLVNKLANKTTGKNVVCPDPTAPAGSATNPHVFSGGEDTYVYGGMLTDTNPNNWPDAQLSRIRAYTGSGYGPTNTKLRDDIVQLEASGKVGPSIKAFDQAFHLPQAKTNEDWVVLTRGTSRREFNDNDFPGFKPFTSGGNQGTTEELKFLEGQSFTQHGFGSTSLDIDPAFSHKHIRVIYRIPPGSRMIYVDRSPQTGYGANGLSTCQGEREVLLPRGSTYKVLEVRDSTSNAFSVDVVVELTDQKV